MSFPSALTTGQIAQVQQTKQSARQYLLLCPNDIIWQTQPNENISDTVYAEFLWTGTLQGDSADVKEGMTVLITTSDSDLSTIVYRGRVRKQPDGTTFYINETSATLSTAYYVTVLNDWDIHEKLERRAVDGTAYKDWGLTFQNLPPIITGLQSVYIDTSGAATVVFDFTATVDPTANGAAVSTYSWFVDDGTINSGAGTATINVTFPGAATNEQRWVVLTVTDDNGVANYFAFEVYTVDLTDTSSNVITLTADQVAITGSIGEGFNLSVRAWDGFSSVLDRTRCALLSIDDYNGMRKLPFTSGGTYEVLAGNTITGATSGATAVIIAIDLDSGTWAGGDAVGSLWVNTQSGTFQAENLNVGANSNVATIAANSAVTPITQNVSFVGRLRQSGSFTTGDERYGVLKDTRLTIEGFVSQLTRLHGAGLYIKTDATPTVWGEVDTLTIKRAIVFMLAWHSTYTNVSGVTFDADSNDYVWPEFVVQEASLLEWVNSVADDQNAQLVVAADGQSTIQRDARIAGVAGLTTVYNFTTADMKTFTLDIEEIDTYAQAIIGAATYNTTSSSSTVYVGRAPAQAFGPGWESGQVNQQIMKANLTDAQARTEAGSRVANYLATLNPRPRLTVELKTGFYWLVPTVHQLYTFTIAATDNTRGRAYTTANKWLCTDISYDYNPQRGYYTWSGTFELIVAGGAAGIQVTLVPDVNDLRLPVLPGVPAGFGDILDPLINYPVDDPDYELPAIDGINEPEPYQPQPQPGCEILNVSMKTGSIVTTSGISVFGEPYAVRVEGSGQVQSTTTWNYEIFTNSALVDFTLLVGSALPTSVRDVQSGPDRYLTFEVDFGAAGVVDTVVLRGRFDNNANTHQLRLRGYLGAVEVYNSTQTPATHASGSYDYTFNPGGINMDKIDVRWLVSVADTIGFGKNEKVTLDGTGTNPFTGAGGTDQYGDAFYIGYNLGTPTLYTGSDGFQVDSARPSGIPTYQSSHSYTFITTGTGAPLGFRFLDSAGYSDNSNSQLTVTICGQGMVQG